MLKKPTTGQKTAPGQIPAKTDPNQKLDASQSVNPSQGANVGGNQQLRKAQDEARAYKDKYEELLKKHEENTATYLSAINSHNTEMAGCKEENSRLMNELDAEKKKSQDFLIQMSDLKNKLMIQNGDASSRSNEQLAQKDQEIRRLTDELAERNKMAAQFRGQIDDMTLKLEEKDSMLEELQSQLNDLYDQNLGLEVQRMKGVQEAETNLPPLQYEDGEDDHVEVVTNESQPQGQVQESMMKTIEQTGQVPAGLSDQQTKLLKLALSEAKALMDKQKEQIQSLTSDKQALQIEVEELKDRRNVLEAELHRQSEDYELRLLNLQANIEELQININDQSALKTLIEAPEMVKQQSQKQSFEENQNNNMDSSVQPIHVFHSLVTPSAKELERVNYAQMRQRIAYQEMEIQQLRQQLERVQHLQQDNQILRNKMQSMMSLDNETMSEQQIKTSLREKSSSKMINLMKTNPNVGNLLKSLKEGGVDALQSQIQTKIKASSRNTSVLYQNESILDGAQMSQKELPPQENQDQFISEYEQQNLDKTVIDIVGDDNADDINTIKAALAAYQQGFEALKLEMDENMEEHELEIKIKNDEIMDIKHQLEEEKKKEKSRKTDMKKKVLKDLMVQTDRQVSETKDQGLQTLAPVKDLIIRQTPQLISDDGLTYNMNTDGYFCIQDKTGYNKYSIAGNVIIDTATNMKVRMNGIYKDLQDMYQIRNGIIDFTTGKPNSEYKLTPLEDTRSSYPALENQILVYKKELQRIELENDDLRFQLQKLREQISRGQIDQQINKEEQDKQMRKGIGFESRYIQTDEMGLIHNKPSVSQTQLGTNVAIPKEQIEQLLQNSQINLNPIQQQQLTDPILQLMQQQLSQNNVLISHLLGNQPPSVQTRYQAISPNQINQGSQVLTNSYARPAYQNQNYAATSPTIPSVHQLSLDDVQSKFVQTELQVVSLDDFLIQNEKYKQVTRDRTQLILDQQKMRDLEDLLKQKQAEIKTTMKIVRELNQTIGEKDSLLVVQANQIQQLYEQLGASETDRRCSYDPASIFKSTNAAMENQILGLQQRLKDKEETIAKLQQLLDQTRKEQQQRIAYLAQQLANAQTYQDEMKNMEIERYKRDLQLEELRGNASILDALNGKQLADHQQLVINQGQKIDEQEHTINKCRKALDALKRGYNDQLNKALYLEKAATSCKGSLKMVCDINRWIDISQILDANQFDALGQVVSQRVNWNGSLTITPIIMPQTNDPPKSTLIPQSKQTGEKEASEPAEQTMIQDGPKKIKRVIRSKKE